MDDVKVDEEGAYNDEVTDDDSETEVHLVQLLYLVFVALILALICLIAIFIVSEK